MELKIIYLYEGDTKTMWILLFWLVKNLILIFKLLVIYMQIGKTESFDIFAIYSNCQPRICIIRLISLWADVHTKHINRDKDLTFARTLSLLPTHFYS